MGNPHVVFYCVLSHLRSGCKTSSKSRASAYIGSLCGTAESLKNTKSFPRRINVHFVEVHSPGEVTMATWERGSGITLACGTGASAVCVAGVLTGRTDRKILAHLPGGDLELEWADDNHVYMTGRRSKFFPATGPEPEAA